MKPRICIYVVMSSFHQDERIKWYDIRTKYLSPRIYPSQKQSIWDNLRFRILTQNRQNVAYPFPIDLIKMLFTNAEKLKSVVDSDDFSEELLNEAIRIKQSFDEALEAVIERIRLVAKSNVSNQLWNYPLFTIEKIGFDKINGTVHIQAYDNPGKSSALYSQNPVTKKFELITGVESMKDLHLDHIPRMDDILQNWEKSLYGFRELEKMSLYSFKLNYTNYPQHKILWEKLLIMLPEILREVKIIFSQTNLCLTLASHNLKKG